MPSATAHSTSCGSPCIAAICVPIAAKASTVSSSSVRACCCRGVTGVVATPPRTVSRSPDALRGTPGSHGTVTGTARTVRGPSDFGFVQPGDILVCLYTDPAWTPLFRIAAGGITETGGALSHAAIVAREYGIPAVLGVSDALNLITSGARLTLDGTAGTITPA